MFLGNLFCGELNPGPHECKANTLPTELLGPQPWEEQTGKADKQNRTHTKKNIGKLRVGKRQKE